MNSHHTYYVRGTCLVYLAHTVSVVGSSLQVSNAYFKDICLGA